MEFGAQEVALEAPEIFLVAPEMAPATELAKIPEIEPVLALGIAQGIAQSNRWVLSSPPWVSSSMADRLTW